MKRCTHLTYNTAKSYYLIFLKLFYIIGHSLYYLNKVLKILFVLQLYIYV